MNFCWTLPRKENSTVWDRYIGPCLNNAPAAGLLAVEISFCTCSLHSLVHLRCRAHLVNLHETCRLSTSPNASLPKLASLPVWRTVTPLLTHTTKHPAACLCCFGQLHCVSSVRSTFCKQCGLPRTKRNLHSEVPILAHTVSDKVRACLACH